MEIYITLLLLFYGVVNDYVGFGLMDARGMVDAALKWTTAPLKVNCTILRPGVNRYAGIKLLSSTTLRQITVAITFHLPFIVNFYWHCHCAYAVTELFLILSSLYPSINQKAKLFYSI